MLVNIIGKNVEITESMRMRAEKKLLLLEKYFKDYQSLIARVLVKVYGTEQKVEVSVDTPIGLLRAEVKDFDFYAALDKAIDRLEDQIRRYKTKFSHKHKEKLSLAFLEEQEFEQEQDERLEPVRTKSIIAKKMNLNDAILTMELLGHDFFVYTDDETNEVAVVYRRREKGYGLLEVEK